MDADRVSGWAITRFEFRRDRVIGDSQVAFDRFHGFALELTDSAGRTGLGFGHALRDPMPALTSLEATFAEKVWPELDGAKVQPHINRVVRLRGGNQMDPHYGFGEALQVALWDLAAQQAGLPLADYLGATDKSVPAYASGLDFHLSDAEFSELFGQAANVGFTTFKIKVGHRDPERDLHRLVLLKQVAGQDAGIMVDANEAWSPKEAGARLDLFRRAGHDLIWVEDPILRSDVRGLKALCQQLPWTMVNSGEYLDAEGRANLLADRAVDILNLHGRISETMRLGWMAAALGLPVAMGNTNLEIGVHAGAALPNANWIEYSFQNYDHLVDEPITFQDGRALVPDRPGIGFALSDAARTEWAAPEPLAADAVRTAPTCRLMGIASKARAVG